MANKEHLDILKQGAEIWNSWRRSNSGTIPDLRNADLSGSNLYGVQFGLADLRNADLRNAHLIGANLNGALLCGANLSWAFLSGAMLRGASLIRADLTRAFLDSSYLVYAKLCGANLSGAKLISANLNGADLRRANLSDADLREATLVEANLRRATLSGARIYGISSWNTNLADSDQINLVITRHDEPIITVDRLDVAQFVYLLIENKNLRNIIATVANRAVLILGRLSDTARKEILNALSNKLRTSGYLPIIFDFDGATERDITETVKILAGMSLFIVADITSPKSTPLELQAIVPDFAVPFVPIIQEAEEPFSMFRDLQNKHDWMMDVRKYSNKEHLLASFDHGILNPALEKHQEILTKKNAALRIKRIDE
jgi:hypothetical protein